MHKRSFLRVVRPITPFCSAQLTVAEGAAVAQICRFWFAATRRCRGRRRLGWAGSAALAADSRPASFWPVACRSPRLPPDQLHVAAVASGAESGQQREGRDVRVVDLAGYAGISPGGEHGARLAEQRPGDPAPP